MKKLLFVLSVILLAILFVVPTFALKTYSVVAARLVLGDSLGIILYTDQPFNEAPSGTYNLNGRTETVKPVKEGNMLSLIHI